MSDRLELRCLLRADCAQRRVAQVPVLTDVTEQEAEASPPGIGIVYPQPGDTLWTIGRRYRVSGEELRAVNGGIEEAHAGKPLLILKGKHSAAKQAQ